MITNNPEENTGCALCKSIRDGTSMGEIRRTLWQYVWQYWSAFTQCDASLDDRDFPWMLASSSFIGCLDTFRFILHSFIQFQENASDRQEECRGPTSSATTMKTIHNLINQRSVCVFRIPDSWVHNSERLALTPLHLACWRLDLPMIQTLLHLGADPSALALESMDSPDQPSKENNCHNQNEVLFEGERFYSNQGLSPLAFAVLGVRSPPKHTTHLAAQHCILHNVYINYTDRQLSPADLDNLCDSSDCCTICHSFLLSVENNIIDTPPDDVGLDVTKEELVTKCIELLISAGANLNEGLAKCLNCAFPLDLMIQPPIRIYSSSNFARSTQSTSNLRRYDLEENFPVVASACHVMLAHNATLSPSFVSLYSWKPHYLDCFTLNHSEHAAELIKIITRLGLFSDEDDYSRFSAVVQNSTDDSGRHCGAGSVLDNDEDGGMRDLSKIKNMQTFMAGIVNAQCPKESVSIAFQWFSVPSLHLFCRLASMIIETSQFDMTYLADLVQIALQGQHRSLAHSSMLVILKRVNASKRHTGNIQTLPLPNVLKRRLLFRMF